MANQAFGKRVILSSVTLLALSACGSGFGDFDFDLRGGAGQLDTSNVARNAVRDAPQPDARGVVSYPGYQVAIARRGDTVTTVANRIGLPANDIARFNALPTDVPLRAGEIIALPARVPEPGGIQTATLGNGVDVSTIAGSAIDRAEGQGAPGLPSGQEPIRHRVAPGETVFSIARSYDVPVRALADWNGLGPDFALREGQFLLIPTVAPEVEVAALAPASRPGDGTSAPLPPSAATPLPPVDVKPETENTLESPALAAEQTASSDTSRLRMPVAGQIIRPYRKGSNEGIGISASAGASVTAADNGTVAAITRDTDQVPILVLRHADNLLTVYAGVDDIAVEKGDTVKRGQKIAEVRAASPAFLHFEVREGFESVDPVPYLN